MTRDERIAELSRMADWRAALLILNSDRFSEDGRVWRHVDLRHHSIFFSKILADGTFSGGEIALLKIAASLFSTDVEINLWRELGRLDEEACGLALRAMASYCRIDAALIDAERARRREIQP